MGSGVRASHTIYDSDLTISSVNTASYQARFGPHRAALARGGKGAKNAANVFLKIHEKIKIVSFIMCLRARKTKRYGQRVPSSAITLIIALNLTGSPVSKT